MKKIAILYQAALPPIKEGIQKPMKPGGYSDSGADIAFELSKNGLSVVTPIKKPNLAIDKDWVFPDTKSGIENALKMGANTFWLNTVLYKNHPIENFYDQQIQWIGQTPELVDLYDDKFYTNALLKSKGIPIPDTELRERKNLDYISIPFDFPLVIKPLRGRGSQGVFLVHHPNDLKSKLEEVFNSQKYGNTVYLERYLEGQEITITVMPKGAYDIKNRIHHFEKPWCLPAVKRFNHQNGIAPYSGLVAVLENSAVLTDDELNSAMIKAANYHCIQAAELLEIKAPIRIDCRADENGKYFLFDLNLKPNMTGPSRPHRKNQDSLSLLAAQKIGWNYFDLLHNILKLF